MEDGTKLAYAMHSEVKSLIGENPFEKSEEETIKAYNSSVTQPLVLFLGLDERYKEDQGGFKSGLYSGRPYFAIDVTAKGTVKKEAEGIIEAMKAKGLEFVVSRAHMSINAPEGLSLS